MAKVQKANKWPDVCVWGVPWRLRCPDRQTDRQMDMHTHTPWSPCHPFEVILITEDTHPKTASGKQEKEFCLSIDVGGEFGSFGEE